ncbi:MAG: DUF1573 domain-containing protein [Bacteroidota bacterium]
MNKVIISSFLSLCILLSFQLHAQAQKPFKELKSIWKQLSPEAQAQLLTFAQKQLAGPVEATASPEIQTVPDQKVTATQPEQPVMLKKNDLSLGSSTATISLGAEAEAVDDTPATTSVAWGGEIHDFGLINQGETVKHTFEFTNTGAAPLTISNVKPSCGCTTPNYTKSAIAPGEKGFVEVAFNSKGKMGMQNKSVVVYMNTDRGTSVLRFKGEIVAADATPKNER